MEHRRAWITASDGTRLAAQLWLPRELPAPVVLEALPYRMDDLTATYASEYERLCREGGLAVCRLDIRGTGSSGGIAVDEYTADEHADICDVIAWLAAQEWSNGRVGMYGASWSGFNSLQVACLQPPALQAIAPIYASDDRYTDDVHYMGGILKAVDLVDWVLYMVAGNALPPVPAVVGDAWREEWEHRLEEGEPWLLRWLEEQADGPYWRHGSVRPDYGRIACPTMIVAGWADGYTNIVFRALESLRCPTRVLLGPWGHGSPATAIPGPHVDLVPELIRWFRRWLADERNGVDEEPPLAVFARRSTRPDPMLPEMRGEWRERGRLAAGAALGTRPAPGGQRRRPDPGSRRRRTGSVDLVRGPSAVGTPGRPAARRRPLPLLRLGAARRGPRRDGPPTRAPHGHLGPTGRLPLRAALRRVPGRGLGARRPRRPQPHPPDRARTHRSRSSRECRRRWRSSWRRPRGCSSQGTAYGSRSRAPTGRTHGRLRPARRSSSIADRCSSSSRCSTARATCPRRGSPRRPASTRMRPTRSFPSPSSSGASRTTSSARESRAVTSYGSVYDAPFGARVSESCTTAPSASPRTTLRSHGRAGGPSTGSPGPRPTSGRRRRST